ncbi:MAG: zinc-ribbon domain-containing protein [Thermoplasmatota archaeon]
MKTCPSCDTENPAKAKFCMECGTPLPQAQKCDEDSWDESAGGP